MKRYIKPNTESVLVALQQMMTTSGPDALAGGGTNDPNDLLGKENAFFTDPESAEKNEYPVYNLWED